LQHLRITKRKQQEVAAKLKQGVSRTNILNKVRESFSGNLGRHHLIVNKDLAYIEHAYGLRNIHCHSNKQQSVLAWKEECRQSEHNPILYCKLQGQEAEESPDTFVFLTKVGSMKPLFSPTRTEETISFYFLKLPICLSLKNRN